MDLQCVQTVFQVLSDPPVIKICEWGLWEQGLQIIRIRITGVQLYVPNILMLQNSVGCVLKTVLSFSFWRSSAILRKFVV